ncbi:nucleoside-diphosphate-sugar epimerase [Rheinheimera sp. A13L]|uniref:NAD-dependent epimerase/dehydratase family protein n=1 Tax=Rheinheimera sp. A13L TaxID=506534 RepID=UPI00021254A9|nr:NAD-dependent epimerase/dehydratase family protein [Rheinheimera sp. A13L]EGM78165.1 nucleoside-diphosphate-sugar epimerase [Rheinheimera sp. A13L]
MKFRNTAKPDKVLLTGATGFIGKALLKMLASQGYQVVAPARAPLVSSLENVTMPLLDDIGTISSISNSFSDCDVVIHLAGKAHLAVEAAVECSRVNRDATLNFARLAHEAGVKRFIFLSSVSVHGQASVKPFNITDHPKPIEMAALSKLEAEVGLKLIAQETGMEVVIIRSTLVYGPNAPGNFGKLLKLSSKNLPLPLGAVFNKRSLVGLDNLIDLIVTCISHPKAANQTFLVSDDDDLSTTELLNMMADAAGRRSRLLSIPVSWLKFTGKLIGKQAVIDRLCGNLQVDISHTKETLGWMPPISVKEGIRRCFIKVDLC